MIIKDIMTRNPVCVEESVVITEAKEIMDKNKFGKLPVLDKNKKLVGVITKNDIAKASPSNATTLDKYEINTLLEKLTVGKCMKKDVYTVTEDELVEEAAKYMIDKNIGCVPVLKEGLLTGIVTESDLFELFTNMLGARHAGVRVSFTTPDKAGTLAKITTGIANENGNIVAIATNDLENSSNKQITIKAENISLDKMKAIISETGSENIDIRNV